MPARVTRVPEWIGIVVPAHNEEDLLGACVAALDEAAARVDVPVHLVVALDACVDGTADVSVVTSARRVGRAPKGFSAYLGRLADSVEVQVG